MKASAEERPQLAREIVRKYLQEAVSEFVLWRCVDRVGACAKFVL